MMHPFGLSGNDRRRIEKVIGGRNLNPQHLNRQDLPDGGMQRNNPSRESLVRLRSYPPRHADPSGPCTEEEIAEAYSERSGPARQTTTAPRDCLSVPPEALGSS